MSVIEEEQQSQTQQRRRFSKDKIAINPKLDKLITSLRTAIEEGEGSLDKESTGYDDILDAFRLSLKNYKFRNSL